MLEYGTPLTIATGDAASASVIWLHGLGANGYDFLSILEEMDLTGCPPIRFIFPHAPAQPVTLNGGYVMPSWYDIAALNAQAVEDEAGLRHSINYLDGLIDEEIARGIAPERIVLAGFSQGGNVALNCAVRYRQRLAGVMALSTYLGLADKLPAEASAANRGLAIFMAHGTHDDVVSYAFARDACQRLQAERYAVEWHAYAMAHAINADEVNDIGNWLRKRFAA